MNLGLGMLEVGLLDSGTSRVVEVAEAACKVYGEHCIALVNC